MTQLNIDCNHGAREKAAEPPAQEVPRVDTGVTAGGVPLIHNIRAAIVAAARAPDLKEYWRSHGRLPVSSADEVDWEALRIAAAAAPQRRQQ